MTNLEQKVDQILTMVARLDERVEGQCDRIAAIDRALHGGDDGEKGLVSRVAILREGAERQRWAIRALFGAIIAAVVGLAATVFSRH